MIELKQWLEELIALFRKEYSKLNEIEKKQINDLENFSPKCQLELIQIEDPDFQILIATHFNEKKDMEILIHNPIQMYQTIELFDKILKNRKWGKPLSPELQKRVYPKRPKKEMRYRFFLEKYFHIVYQNLKQRIASQFQQSPDIYFKYIIVDKDFGWVIRGNLVKTKPSKIIEDIIKNAKRRFPKKKKTKTLESKNLKGFGTYFYPPIWIDKIPKYNFKETYGPKPFQIYSTIIYSLDYRGKKLVLYKDGEIGISEDNKENALRIINEIFSIFNLKYGMSFAVRESELSDIEIDPNDYKIVRSTSPMISLRTRLSQDRWGGLHSIPVAYKRNEIPKEKLLKIINISEKIKERKLSDLLILNLEAHSHFFEIEYLQSFILSWVIVEKNLSEKWQEYIKKLKITGKRKERLSNPHDWSISYIIETLNMCNKISKDYYEKLTKLRKKRNNSIHKGAIITKEDAIECLAISSQILLDKIKPLEK